MVGNAVGVARRSTRTLERTMSQSPYAPPTADVRDAVEVPRARPDSMYRSVVCIWISAALTTVAAILQVVGLMPAEGGPVVSALIAVVSVCVLALIAVKVGQGRNWARWFFTAIYIVGTLAAILVYILTPQLFIAIPILGKVSAVIQFGLQTAAFTLMFTPASQQWFHSMR